MLTVMGVGVAVAVAVVVAGAVAVGMIIAAEAVQLPQLPEPLMVIMMKMQQWGTGARVGMVDGVGGAGGEDVDMRRGHAAAQLLLPLSHSQRMQLVGMRTARTRAL